MSDSADKTDPWEKHRSEQVIRFAKETTPTQRLRLLEEMLYFLHAAGNDYLAAKHGSTKAISGGPAKANSKPRLPVLLSARSEVVPHSPPSLPS